MFHDDIENYIGACITFWLFGAAKFGWDGGKFFELPYYGDIPNNMVSELW